MQRVSRFWISAFFLYCNMQAHIWCVYKLADSTLISISQVNLKLQPVIALFLRKQIYNKLQAFNKLFSCVQSIKRSWRFKISMFVQVFNTMWKLIDLRMMKPSMCGRTDLRKWDNLWQFLFTLIYALFFRKKPVMIMMNTV